MKLQALACNFIKKETLAVVFSCEFCEISKNTFSYRTPPMAASVSAENSVKFAQGLPSKVFKLKLETFENKECLPPKEHIFY